MKLARLLMVLAAMCGFMCNAAGAAETAAVKKKVVAFAQDTMANDWRAAQVRDLQKAFAGHPDIEFIFTDANGDTARQVQDIEKLAAQGVAVLITSPREWRRVHPVHRRR